jgi:hypothetical protein
MDEKQFERKEKARLDEMYDAMIDDSDCEYDIEQNQKLDYDNTLSQYEKDFADAFTRLIKAGYGNDAITLLKYKTEKEQSNVKQISRENFFSNASNVAPRCGNESKRNKIKTN